MTYVSLNGPITDLPADLAALLRDMPAEQPTITVTVGDLDPIEARLESYTVTGEQISILGVA